MAYFAAVRLLVLRLCRLDVRDGFAFPVGWLSASGGCAAIGSEKIAALQKWIAEMKNGANRIHFANGNRKFCANAVPFAVAGQVMCRYCTDLVRIRRG